MNVTNSTGTSNSGDGGDMTIPSHPTSSTVSKLMEGQHDDNDDRTGVDDSKKGTRRFTGDGPRSSSVSSKLYGHDLPRRQLKEAFERCCYSSPSAATSTPSSTASVQARTEIIIITGASGTGKTALAKTLKDECKYFISGKCDQIQRGSEPFGPFVSALTQLANEVLSARHEQQDSTSSVASIQRTVEQAISELAEINLLIDMVPALEGFFPNKMKGLHRNKSSSGGPSASSSTVMKHPDVENPTLTVVCKFLRSICSRERNIVLVIDDLQWIDSSSLELIEKIAEETIPMEGFMLVATSRDDEMTFDHPASQVLPSIQQGDSEHVSVSYISMGNLSLDAVKELTSDHFPTLPSMGLESLSTALYQHTKGNAFFVTQCIQHLETSGWEIPSSYLDEETEGGSFEVDDRSSIVDKFITYDCDALVEFRIIDMANRSPLIRHVLKVASCLGPNFVSSNVIMVARGDGKEEIEGKEVVHGATTTTTTSTDPDSSNRILDALTLIEGHGIINQNHGAGHWSWTHDKYQKAAYLLIDERERELFHLSVGRQLLKNLNDDELQTHVFVAASQFGIALRLIAEEDEKEKVAGLFLRAGEKSASSSSFGAAASYFAMGTSLLKVDNWVSQYQLSLRLYNAAAEMECFRGRFQQTDKLVNVILRNTTRTVEDQVRAYGIRIYALSARQEIEQAICVALDIFHRLGEKFPTKPRPAKVLYEVLSTKWLLSGKTENDIMSLPSMSDTKKIGVLKLMLLAFPALLRGNPELAAVVACRCMKLTLQHGLCGMGCGSFMAVSVILLYPMGHIDESIKLANIGQRIIEEYGINEMKCRGCVTMYIYCLPYKRPMQEMLDPLEKGAQLGLITGDVDIACLCSEFRAIMSLFCGYELNQILSETTDHLKNCKKWGQPYHVSYTSILLQTLESLVHININEKADPCTLIGKAFNENIWMKKSKEAHNDLEGILFWLFKAFLAMFMGEYEKATEFVSVLMKQNLHVANAPIFHQGYFIAAFADVAMAREEKSRNATTANQNYTTSSAESENSNNSGRSRKRTKRKFKNALSKLKFYCKLAADNLQSKVYLIEAEKAVLKNDKNEAKLKFQLSSINANKQGLIHEEALAYERYAVAMMEWGDMTESLEFFERARCLYKQWGSYVKVRNLIHFVREKFGINSTSWNNIR